MHRRCMHVTIPVQDSIERQVILLVLLVTNGDDFLEALHQYEQDQQGECHRAHVDDQPKGTDHDEGKDPSGPPFPPPAVHLAQNDAQGASATDILKQ